MDIIGMWEADQLFLILFLESCDKLLYALQDKNLKNNDEFKYFVDNRIYYNGFKNFYNCLRYSQKIKYKNKWEELQAIYSIYTK